MEELSYHGGDHSILDVFREISEVGDSIEELQSILKKYLQLVDEAPVGIYIVQDGNIIFGNKWLCDYSGYCPDDLPMSALNVIAPEDRPFVAEQMTRRARGEDALPSYPVRFLKKNGDIFEVQLIANLITYHGKPAIIGSIVDISGRIKAEEKLKEYTTHLESSNRFKHLINEILSHDLLNRLWIAEEYSGCILQNGLSEEQKENIDRLKDSLNKAMCVLGDAHKCIFLDDKTELEHERIDVAAILGESLRDLESLIKGKNIKVLLPPNKKIMITGSPLLKDVFSNLMSNAVKYSPHGSSLEIEIEDGEAVRVRFKDRGPGIPDNLKEMVFRKFERLERKYIKGIGLGLAIVRRLVDLHGGKVWVEDNPGGGSVFIVELPKTLSPGGKEITTREKH